MRSLRLAIKRSQAPYSEIAQWGSLEPLLKISKQILSQRVADVEGQRRARLGFLPDVYQVLEVVDAVPRRSVNTLSGLIEELQRLSGRPTLIESQPSPNRT